MKRLGIILMVVVLFGCAKVSVETKKPIKVDINMRLDVYQHVVEDVESIEGEIYGNNNAQMNSIFSLPAAYAADSPQDAIERRKSRAKKIETYFNNGYIGENRNAYLQPIESNLSDQVKEVIDKENKDRKIIYQNTADKNNVSLSAAEKIFFNDHYKRAPSGWNFEVYSQEEGKYTWQKK